MILVHYSKDAVDALEGLQQTLDDPAAAIQQSHVVNMPQVTPENAEVAARELISKRQADWVVSHQEGSDPTVYADRAIAEGHGAARVKSLIETTGVNVVFLAPASPPFDLDLIPRPDSPPAKPVEPGKSATEEPAEPPKPKAEEPTEPAKAIAGEPPEPMKPPAVGTPNAASTSDLIRELALARRSAPPYVEEWLRANPDLIERLASSHLSEQEALNAAIVWPGPDQHLLDLVVETDRAALARELLRSRHGGRVFDSQLIDMVADKQKLAATILRARAGVPEMSEELAKQRVALEEKRVQYFGQLVNHAAEYVEQRKRWRALSRWVPWILVGSLVISLLLTTGVLWLINGKVIDGWQGALLIFVLALMAISPTVLLLLERPLEGMDKFEPPGSKPTGSGSDDAAGEETDKSDDKVEPKTKK